MFFIIWRGWGFLVIPLSFVGGLAGFLVALGFAALGIKDSWAIGVAGLVASGAGWAAIWYTAKALAGGPQRRLVDPNTGEQFVIRRDAGSLFFIPTRWWAFIYLVLGVLGSLAIMFTDLSEDGPSAADPVVASSVQAS